MAHLYPAFVQRVDAFLPVAETDRGDVVSVANRDQLIQVVKAACNTHTPISPDVGQAVHTPRAVLVDMGGMNQVIRHRQTEFLIHVEAGLTAGQVQEVLDEAGQRLAHLYSKSRSMLSILGEETPSLSETCYGPLRRWVVGTEVVTGDGEPVHYGGEVVKNVTGYDLNKLFVGSRHRYGIVHSVILKTLPKPEMSRAFLFHVEALDDALELMHRFDRMLSRPEVLTLFRTKTTFGWQILLVLSGYREVVQQEGEAVHDAVEHLNTDLQELFLAPRALDQWVQRLDWLHPEEPEALVVHVALGHKQVMDLPYRFMGQRWMKSADVLMPMRTNRLLLRWISVNLPQAAELDQLKAQVAEWGGFVEIVRIPPVMNLQAESFNQVPNPVIQTWTRRLKEQYDPFGILPGGSPGMPVPQTQEEAPCLT